jgi:hypothetical protein
VSCVTLPYAEAVARLNVMMLSSYLEKERKMNTVGIVMLLITYILPAHIITSTYIHYDAGS